MVTYVRVINGFHFGFSCVCVPPAAINGFHFFVPFIILYFKWFELQMSTLIIVVDLDCRKCYHKIRKILCQLQGIYILSSNPYYA